MVRGCVPGAPDVQTDTAQVLDMAIEAERGCGYRKVGGYYLRADGQGFTCDRTPYPLGLCPVCQHGIHFGRGVQWVDWHKFAGQHTECMELPQPCMVCHPKEGEKVIIMWVGERWYTPEKFKEEAATLGLSKRIASVPRKFKLGETWVFLAHKKAGPVGEDGKPTPAIFFTFLPSRVETLIWQREATTDKIEELAKRNITPIIVPDGDNDHDPANRNKKVTQ